jgi:hypothetical protein
MPQAQTKEQMEAQWQSLMNEEQSYADRNKELDKLSFMNPSLSSGIIGRRLLDSPVESVKDFATGVTSNTPGVTPLTDIATGAIAGIAGLGSIEQEQANREKMMQEAGERSPVAYGIGSTIGNAAGAYLTPVVNAPGKIGTALSIGYESALSAADQLLRGRGEEVAIDDAARTAMAMGALKGGGKVLGGAVSLLPGGKNSPNWVENMYSWMSGITKAGGKVEPARVREFLSDTERRQAVRKMEASPTDDIRRKTQDVAKQASEDINAFRKGVSEPYGELVGKFIAPNKIDQPQDIMNIVDDMNAIKSTIKTHPSSYQPEVKKEINNIFSIINEGIAGGKSESKNSFAKISKFYDAKIDKKLTEMQSEAPKTEAQIRALDKEVGDLINKKNIAYQKSIPYMKETLLASRRRLDNLINKNSGGLDYKGSLIKLSNEDRKLIFKLRESVDSSLKGLQGGGENLMKADEAYHAMSDELNPFMKMSGKSGKSVDEGLWGKSSYEMDPKKLNVNMKRRDIQQNQFFDTVTKVNDFIENNADDPIIGKALDDGRLKNAMSLMDDLYKDYDMRRMLGEMQSNYGPTGNAVGQAAGLGMMVAGAKSGSKLMALGGLMTGFMNPYAMTNFVDRIAGLTGKDPKLVKAVLDRAKNVVEKEHPSLFKKAKGFVGSQLRTPTKNVRMGLQVYPKINEPDEADYVNSKGGIISDFSEFNQPLNRRPSLYLNGYTNGAK